MWTTPSPFSGIAYHSSHQRKVAMHLRLIVCHHHRMQTTMSTWLRASYWSGRLQGNIILRRKDSYRGGMLHWLVYAIDASALA